jgi:hypothetical protein
MGTGLSDSSIRGCRGDVSALNGDGLAGLRAGGLNTGQGSIVMAGSIIGDMTSTASELSRNSEGCVESLV